jgi:hypothetical protein
LTLTLELMGTELDEVLMAYSIVENLYVIADFKLSHIDNGMNFIDPSWSPFIWLVHVQIQVKVKPIA